MEAGSSVSLSRETRFGLKACKYVSPTAVQREVLPHALGGRDVLCAAKTGSGKTLAFVIPVLEKLTAENWSARTDGIGALILTPTRELALQIFEEFRKVGKKHRFSVGLLIGGSGRKVLEEEKTRAGNLNILIATPGRLLQHMDETPYFDCGSMKILVLDEADRILDMGFRASLDAILENLPRGGTGDGRQTLLFSATQTKSVSDLARLNLSNPEYISIHADATVPTPVKLQQAFVECHCAQKLSVLWGFIKTHLKAKVLVFFSTCKQARFVSEAFSKLRPGVPLRCLHGHMKQMKRVAVYDYFSKTKEIVLFATDVASRGLDFPDVDWVIQFDCPDDIPTYIHRVGRTARYLSGGRSLMLLLPSEKPGMVANLAERKIPIKEIKINPQKHQDITQAMVALLAKWPELKDFAQSGLTSYVKSVFLSPSKDVFDVKKMDLRELSHSYGLANPPKLRFLKKAGISLGSSGLGEGGPGEKPGLAERPGRDDASHDDIGGFGGPSDESEESDDEDLLIVKRREIPEAELPDTKGVTSSKKKLKIRDGGLGKGKKIVFDDDGQATTPFERFAAPDDDKGEEDDGEGQGYRDAQERFNAARNRLKEGDVEDKKRVMELRKEKKREAKRKRREASGTAVESGPTLFQEAGEGYSEGESEEELEEGRESKKLALPTSLEDQEALALKLLNS
ncbi:DEAD box RNA helicase [Chloropicon primus]|uniref:ATP-dependent RNA helicase n=2 Tax=Chloropicon primus TaxID=1764295 RepID=A0A5B8MJY2_9CHLO|nr:DEAD box RNA helicase [Chloropicon primus]UPQ99975.1 DEAD box RNA helicase [Chloropicon primus]|eukprot:QDZ20763.1 DEAD box RNA helicase [Chloropicon primus]